MWVPLLFSFLSIIKAVFFISAIASLFTSGSLSASQADYYYQSADLIPDPAAYSLGVFTFFGYLWATCFFKACQMFIIMVAACTWYFSHGSDNKGNAEVGLGFTWAFTKNLGTLCFGSGIIALIEFMKAMLEDKNSRRQRRNNPQFGGA
jgi:hypothetical protein